MRIAKNYMSIFAVSVYLFVLLSYFLMSNWVMKNYSSDLKSFICAYVSYFVFSYILIKLISVLEDSFEIKKTKFDKESDLYIFSLVFVWIVIINTIFFVFAKKMFPDQSYYVAIHNFFLNQTDSPHYFDIANGWYINDDTLRKYDIAFYPLFPILLSSINFILKLEYIAIIAVIINSIFCFFGLYYIFLISKDFMSIEKSKRLLKYMLIIPPAFFYFTPMTESLFLFLTAACFYYLHKKDFFLVMVFSFLASLTRNQGILLVVPIFAYFAVHFRKSYINEQFNKKEIVLTFMCLLMPILGFSIYLYINHSVYGDYFKFLELQKEHWSQGLNFFFNTAKYLPEYILGKIKADDIKPIFSLFIPNIISLWAMLFLISYGVKKLPIHFTLYNLAYFVISYGASWLLSGPRYFIVLFPVFFSLTFLTENKILDRLFTFVFILCYFIYMSMFMARYHLY